MTSGYVTLGPVDVALAASLVVVNAVLSIALGLGLERRLAWAALRMTVQLSLIGYVLRFLFALQHPWVSLLALVPMTIIAGFSAVQRSERRFPGMTLTSIASIGASSWLVTAFALLVVVRSDPWWAPSHAIPFAGLVLGNSLTGIALAIDRFVAEVSRGRGEVETLLALGATRWEAAKSAVRAALRAGLMPMLNSMLVAGIVSTPGMMTGQLLAGADPTQAARYQIVVMFVLAASTALGTMLAVLVSLRLLFDESHRFRAERLTRAKSD